MKNKIKLKKGDEVIVLSGKDRGKTGKIVRVIPDIRKVIVSDVNKYKKHQKPGNNQTGGIIEKESPILLSKVGLYNPATKKADKVGFRFLDDGKKVRFFKSDNEVVDS